MRTSAGSLIIVQEQFESETRYLLKFSPERQSLFLLGGYRNPLETYITCAQRSLADQLNLYPERDFLMHQVPVAQLKYRAFSEIAQQEIWQHHCLFEAFLTENVIEKFYADSQFSWVTSAEIQNGQTIDGKPISRKVRLLFQKTARLPTLQDPERYIIGVIGHETWVSPDINIICSQIDHHLKHAEKLANGRPITMLSSLAMGADQLFAEVGLMRGYSLIAPLPFYRDIYQLDFGKKQGRLRTYLDQTTEWFSLPATPQITREDFMEDQLLRDHFYRAAGEYLVDNSNFLLTLWDGNQQPTSSETSATINYAAHRLNLPPETFTLGVVDVVR